MIDALKQTWSIVGRRIIALFRQSYQLGIHPSIIKKSSVIIPLESGNRDLSLPKSLRPIALLFSIGRRLERLIALKYRILGKEQCSAVSSRFSIDLTTALACYIQTAWDENKVAGTVTIDVQGTFDGIQKWRLSLCLRNQGWQLNRVLWIISFMEVLLTSHVSSKIIDILPVINGHSAQCLPVEFGHLFYRTFYPRKNSSNGNFVREKSLKKPAGPASRGLDTETT